LGRIRLKNEYYCIKGKQNKKKKIQINICPQILIIHLKRFNNKQKLEIKVDFPIRGLDMSKYVLENKDNYDMTYDLFAVAYHIGKVGYGHYYAICYNIITKKWYKFEDSIVSEVKLNEIVNKDAYVLFYRKRNLENFIDLEYLYQSKFINYENLLDDLNKNGNPNHLFQDD
jgi:ubiquitin C-terminal hydrolase